MHFACIAGLCLGGFSVEEEHTPLKAATFILFLLMKRLLVPEGRQESFALH